MGRSTDTNDIRTYCLNHMGGVFDHNYLSKNLFSNVPIANFRKYVTRLESDGLLRKVSKGLFLIGDSELSDRDRIIKHYIGDEAYAHGLIGGSGLLKELGFLDEPGRTTIYSNVAVGNKHLQDFEIDVVESHASYNRYFGGKDINTALELIYLKELIDFVLNMINYKSEAVATFKTSSKFINGSAFYDCRDLTSITIPNSVISIGDYTFSGCTSLTSITIPDSVTRLENNLFDYCTSLETVILPNTLSYIGHTVFNRCSSLQSNEKDDASYLGSESNPYLLLVKSNSDETINCTVDDRCRIIYDKAFYEHESLVSVTIPLSMRMICYMAFSGCSKMNSINYNGTKDQWRDIILGDGWKNNVTIHCSDGDITL